MPSLFKENACLYFSLVFIDLIKINQKYRRVLGNTDFPCSLPNLAPHCLDHMILTKVSYSYRISQLFGDAWVSLTMVAALFYRLNEGMKLFDKAFMKLLLRFTSASQVQNVLPWFSLSWILFSVKEELNSQLRYCMCKSSWVSTAHELFLPFFWWCAFYIIAPHLPFLSPSILMYVFVCCVSMPVRSFVIMLAMSATHFVIMSLVYIVCQHSR